MIYFSLQCRPPLDGSLINSRQAESYMAVGPAYDMGFIPRVRNRNFAAIGLIPNFSPNSLTVMPSIIPVSAEKIQYISVVGINKTSNTSVVCNVEGKGMTINIKGYEVQIDSEDYEKVMAHRWYTNITMGCVYFKTYYSKSEGKENIRLRRHG